tara:strand:- start:8845 stop:9084 length:240 start_codon:yes stop_codon:yes gene_type:complete
MENKATYSPNPNKNSYREFHDKGHCLANTVTFEEQNYKGSFVMLKELTDNYMNIVLDIHTKVSVIVKPTLLFHMSLEAE